MLKLYMLLILFSGSSFLFLVDRAVRYWFTAPDRRALRKAPRVTIEDAEPGQIAKITGRVTCPGAPLTAPLTQRPCVYYEVIVEDFYHHGADGRSTDLVEETQSIDFLLTDETGGALIRSQAMTVLSRERMQLSLTSFSEEATPMLRAFLERHGRTSAALSTSKQIEAEERVIGVNDTVTVLGLLRWEPDPDPTSAGLGYRDGPKRAVIEAPPGGNVIVSDDPRDSSLVAKAGPTPRLPGGPTKGRSPRSGA